MATTYKKRIENNRDFDLLIADLSTNSMDVLVGQVHDVIVKGQKKVCKFLRLDSSLLIELSRDNKPGAPIHYWPKKEYGSPAIDLAKKAFDCDSKAIQKGEMIAFSSPEELPDDACDMREYFLTCGIISAVVTPLQIGNADIGIVCWESRGARVEWSDDVLNRLKLVSTLFAGAIVFQNTKREFDERFQFDSLLMDLSATLVRAPNTEIMKKLDWGLRRIGEMLEFDRVGVVEFNREQSNFETVYRWWAKGGYNHIDPPEATKYPWLFEKLSRGEMVNVSRISDIPDHARNEKQYAVKEKIKSSIVIPLRVGEELLGAIICNSTRKERTWPEDIITRLRLVGEIIANVLHRNRVQQDLDERLHFEKLLVNLSARFVNVSVDKLNKEIRDGLQAIAQFLDCQETGILTISDENRLSLLQGWADKKIETVISTNKDIFFPWATRNTLEGKVTAIVRVEDLPAEAEVEKKYLLSQGAKSALAVPLTVGKKFLYLFTIISYFSERSWPDYIVQRVMLFGGIIANAIRRRTAELNLREAELRYRTVADFTYDWEYWINPEGKLLYVSPACKRITGYEAREFVDQPELFERIILPEDRHIWVDPEKDTCKAEEPRELRFRIRRRDGQIRWVENICRPLIGDENKCLGYRGSNRDITVRVLAEMELNNSFSEIKRLKEHLEVENIYLKEEIKLEHQHNTIIGKSAAIKTVLKKIEQVAGTDATVLITGETGTGKELIARAIHDLSSCSGRVMVTVNCSALPATLVESELFGREKGAYTGALSKQVGRFEVADGSSLFLDEIGELPMELQAKLLRVLQEGQFERLGSPKPIHVDVRVIAATNRNLSAAVKEGRFREDLFYRLNVFPIDVPPLRERAEDIERLVWFFVRKYGEKMGKNIKVIARRSMSELRRYPWPGNVRELRNIIERAMIIQKGPELTIELPKPDSELGPHGRTLVEVEKEHILKILERTAWRVSGENGAAKILKINPKTLFSRMKKLGISLKRR